MLNMRYSVHWTCCEHNVWRYAVMIYSPNLFLHHFFKAVQEQAASLFDIVVGQQNSGSLANIEERIIQPILPQIYATRPNDK